MVLKVKEFVNLIGREKMARYMGLDYTYFTALIAGNFPMSPRNKKFLDFIARAIGCERGSEITLDWEGYDVRKGRGTAPHRRVVGRRDEDPVH